MIRRPPRSTLDRSSAASDVYKRQSINKPVGIKILSKGLMGTISLRSALISIPEESAVAYSGKALFDLFMILTLTNDMQTKIRDKAQGTRFKVERLYLVSSGQYAIGK